MKHFFLHFIHIALTSALLVIATCTLASQSLQNAKTEKSKKIAKGVFYTGPSADKHVPDGYGKMTLHGRNYKGISDIIIAGFFEGNQIKNASLYKGDTLCFWGDMQYHSDKKTITLILEKGEIYDDNGNIRYLISSDPIVLSNSDSKIPSYLHGTGDVTTYVDPMGAARYELLTNDGTAIGQTYQFVVKDHDWNVTTADNRFYWNQEYTFDTDDYSTSLNNDVYLGQDNPYRLSSEKNIFERLTHVTGDTTSYYTLIRMSEAYKYTRKNAWCSYRQDWMGDHAMIQNVDRVYYEDGAYTFTIESEGWGSHLGGTNLSGPNEIYSLPFDVCISKPQYKFIVKISQNTLTIICEDQIQQEAGVIAHQTQQPSESSWDGVWHEITAPEVTKFSTSDLVFSNRIEKRNNLTEGQTHNVTIDFLGYKATWSVSGTTEQWPTPIIGGGWQYTSTGKEWKAGSMGNPPYRSKRTVIHTLDLNALAQKAGITTQELLFKIAKTGIDGILGYKNITECLCQGNTSGVKLYMFAATWLAGGFTTPDNEFDKIIKKSIPAGLNKIERGAWVAKQKGRDKTLEYCATQIESATTLSQLYKIFTSMYPILLPEDEIIENNPKELFYSSMLFASYSNSKGDDTDPQIAKYKQRIQAKIQKLLLKEKGRDKEQFLAAVQVYGHTHQAVSIIDHPVKSVHDELNKGIELRAFFDNPTFNDGIRLISKQDPAIQEKIKDVLTNGCYIAVAELQKSLDRDIICNDAERLEEDMILLNDIIAVMNESGFQNIPQINISYLSEKEKDMDNVNNNFVNAPINLAGKNLIRQFFGMQVKEPAPPIIKDPTFQQRAYKISRVILENLKDLWRSLSH
ncbi:MAG: hypothetical protein K6A73_08415 [Bacteroidales bacterium]|nr:hypothetical protein [Bacteroidales bacterium]